MIGKALLALSVIILAGCATSAGPARYGEVTRFARDREVVYPDFAMRYLGERKVASEVFPRGFTFYDFRVKAPNGAEQTVAWSSGTGVIDATDFTVSGRAYALELRGSVGSKKWLRDDEMVVWRAEDYRRALERR